MSPNMPTFWKGNLGIRGHLSRKGAAVSTWAVIVSDTGADQNNPQMQIDVSMRSICKSPGGEKSSRAAIGSRTGGNPAFAM